MSILANKFTFITLAVGVSMLVSALPIAVLWWLMSVGFFGIIVAPPVDLGRWFLYMVFALTATAFIFGPLLREGLRMIGLKITSQRSNIIGFISPIFLFFSIAIISLTQYANGRFDGLTASAGFILSLSTAIILSNFLSRSMKQ